MSVHEILRHWSSSSPEAGVIFAPGRPPFTWSALATLLDEVGQTLANAGVRRTDRVAVVLPDGPEMATAFLTISACAIFAPLNPAYREEDFEFYLPDLRAKTVVLPANADSPARAVAQKRGIKILELNTEAGMLAGQFSLESADGVSSSDEIVVDWTKPDDVALILHTSGTTSPPKMVPLTHANLCSSARNIAQALALTPNDRGLCLMPLFHIHGLIGALLSSITAGASVVCLPGFSASGFFAALEEFAPSWFTAVPTMHQALLAEASQHLSVIRTHPLRFLRASSAALPPRVLQELESVFAAPVIESYGMTETAHQMTSNPLPPGERKPGSVGIAAGPEVAIMDEAGELLASDATGEVVIRGASVMGGYENDPAANAAAFTNGWFRTGDQGQLDADGYLFITGRLKETINRGGEKIAPREIDEALLDHPAVREAVAFAVPHPTLGEDIAAAVVLQAGAACDEAELRSFALSRLPAVKTPTRIILLSEIPRGPTGKVQRIGLAERLAQELATAYEAPASETETLVASTICTILEREAVGRHDNFFSLGGDSLRAVRVMARLRQPLGIEIPVFLLFQFPTPALLATELDRRVEEFDLAALAAELEKLSAEEIERLLGDPIG